MNGREVEEVLEALWICSENGNHDLQALKEECDVPVDEGLLSALEADQLVVHDGGMVLLTRAGRGRAAAVIRRHRLAERLFTDILNIPLHQAEKGACEFEHILAPQVVDSICTLLGHPRECPHGAAIPEGTCCLEAKDVVDSMVVPLVRLETGATAKIAYVSTPSHPRLHKLMSFGLTPGAVLNLHQKSPSYVISCGQTEIALEEDVARDIYVWRGG